MCLSRFELMYNSKTLYIEIQFNTRFHDEIMNNFLKIIWNQIIYFSSTFRMIDFLLLLKMSQMSHFVKFLSRCKVQKCSTEFLFLSLSLNHQSNLWIDYTLISSQSTEIINRHHNKKSCCKSKSTVSIFSTNWHSPFLTVICKALKCARNWDHVININNKLLLKGTSYPS